MTDKKHRSKWFGLGQSRKFHGSDDDTDNPDMDPGSWMSLLFVLALLALGVALMIALAYSG